MEMTNRPFSGWLAISVAPRHAEDMLADIAQDQVGADRRHLVEPRLAVLALDIVFLGEAEAAMGLEAGLGRGPGGIGAEHLAHVGLLAAVLAALEFRQAL